MRLKRRWLAFCRRAGAAGREEEAFAELDRRYREAGRHYHTWSHVADCLRELRRARQEFGQADAQALELAVWFHDAVYEPGRQDNEALSAELALQWASILGLAPALGKRTAGLILATAHSQRRAASRGATRGVTRRETRRATRRTRRSSQGLVPEDPAEALLRDIDLAVLGGCWASYRRYERGIVREYARMPPESFREGRAELLHGFLARPELYATPAFRQRLERRARRNLACSVMRLTGRPLARLKRD